MQAAQMELQLSGEALAAAEREAVATRTLTKGAEWSKRVGKFGFVCAQFSDCNGHD
jgi:hypothetical protein